jgi:hypothetical protein
MKDIEFCFILKRRLGVTPTHAVGTIACINRFYCQKLYKSDIVFEKTLIQLEQYKETLNSIHGISRSGMISYTDWYWLLLITINMETEFISLLIP